MSLSNESLWEGGGHLLLKKWKKTHQPPFAPRVPTGTRAQLYRMDALTKALNQEREVQGSRDQQAHWREGRPQWQQCQYSGIGGDKLPVSATASLPRCIVQHWVQPPVRFSRLPGKLADELPKHPSNTLPSYLNQAQLIFVIGN